jgi:hypothetical protein
MTHVNLCLNWAAIKVLGAANPAGSLVSGIRPPGQITKRGKRRKSVAGSRRRAGF